MKKNLLIIAVLILVGTLAACTGLSNSNNTRSANRTVNTNANSDPTTLSVEAKAGVGILKLEGTDQSVTAEEAKALLPLFQALKTLSTNNNTAVDEISALNKQIKTSLTSDQLSSINNMTFTSADIRTLMEQNGLLDASAANSRSGTTSSRTGGFGGPPEGIPGLGGPGGVSTTSQTQATPNAAVAAQSARKVAGGLNLTFAEPIIKLLQSKISQ